MAKKKKKPAVGAHLLATLATVTFPDIWDKKTFTLQYGFLAAGELFKKPNGSAGIFKLDPFMEPDIVGVPIKRLRPTFTGTNMLPQWANTVFDTCGTEVPSLGQGVVLPPYQNTTSVNAAYRAMLQALLTAMKEDDCKLQRIEGLFFRIDKANADKPLRHVLIVRGVYLAGSVASSTGGANTDLIVFATKDQSGGPLPDGGATGPPS